LKDCRNDNITIATSRKGGKIEGLPRGIWEHLSNRYSVGMQDLRVLSVANAPPFMLNKYASADVNSDEPLHIDWNARFSATQRTYAYRILNFTNEQQWGTPFEWDRSWRIRSGRLLNVDAMREASAYLVGSHDFSSFRGASCQRFSPIVTMKDIQIFSRTIGEHWLGFHGLVPGIDMPPYQLEDSRMVTIVIAGESFLYRQVRNMVACLVEVGQGRLAPSDVQEVLVAKSRSEGPKVMAPAHGLFLVDVQHGDFKF
jgi:tRNA pseudouridine38-40 synthase